MSSVPVRKLKHWKHVIKVPTLAEVIGAIALVIEARAWPRRTFNCCVLDEGQDDDLEFRMWLAHRLAYSSWFIIPDWNYRPMPEKFHLAHFPKGKDGPEVLPRSKGGMELSHVLQIPNTAYVLFCNSTIHENMLPQHWVILMAEFGSDL